PVFFLLSLYQIFHLSLLYITILHEPPYSTLFPYTTLFRSLQKAAYVNSIVYILLAQVYGKQEKWKDCLQVIDQHKLSRLSDLKRSEERRVGKECRYGWWKDQ